MARPTSDVNLDRIVSRLTRRDSEMCDHEQARVTTTGASPAAWLVKILSLDSYNVYNVQQVGRSEVPDSGKGAFAHHDATVTVDDDYLPVRQAECQPQPHGRGQAHRPDHVEVAARVLDGEQLPARHPGGGHHHVVAVQAIRDRPYRLVRPHTLPLR